MANAFELLVAELKEIALLGSIGSLLGWDEQTHLPAKGAEYRSGQASLVARMVHERFTSPRIGGWLDAIDVKRLDPASDVAATVRETRRSYDRATKLPTSLVEEMTKTAVLAQAAWVEARKKSEFMAFAPWLEKTLDLKRQEVACVGRGEDPYDTLLDEFEPDETAANLTRVFAELRGALAELVGTIAASGKVAPVEILQRKYPAAGQEKLAREASARVGFDYEAGRLDTSVHPFCSDVGVGDVRLTTRYDEDYFGDAFFGVLHETGHGLYEQGLAGQAGGWYGTPLGQAVSLGIHESQSRMWENLVARSRAFWEFYLPRAKEVFPGVLREVSLDQWYFAVNDVRPSLIRTESDEATYNLHILLRFEVESALLKKELAVGELPGAWKEKMKRYLGVDVPDDARGCLQDIHWSGGAIGYFPTYTLGNLYAAQFFERAGEDLGDLDGMFRRGEFSPLLSWLREKIHRHGKRYPARELVKRVTGKALSAEPLLRHLRGKAGELYGV